MLTTFLNATKRLSRPRTLGCIQNYCQNSNQNESKIHESKLVGVLNDSGKFERCKTVLTQKKFQLIQEWKLQNGGNIGSFEDIAKIKGISKKTVDSLRSFCESQLQNDQQNMANSSTTFEEVLPDEYELFKSGEIYSNRFDSGEPFILYDEPISPIETSAQNSQQMTSHLHNMYTENSGKYSKSLKLVLEPKFCKYSSIRSFTSLYQDATAITCTRFSTNSDWSDIKIDAWNYYKVAALTGAKNLCQMCDQYSEIVEQLPASDIYIMDDHIKAQHFRKPILPKKLAEIVQVNQQCAILVALLHKRNANESNDADSKQSNVYFMCYSTVGRLYNLFVGHEPVSNQSIIKSILNDNDRNEASESLNIDVSKDIRNTYFKSYPVERECLGKSMLIGLTFIRLGLLKANKKSFTDS